MRFGYDLLISVNDRMITPFREDLIFTKLRIHENKTFTNISEFAVPYSSSVASRSNLLQKP